MLLGRLADLPSYGVYTLRILFRRYDIPVTDYTELKLSDRKKEELTQYMRDFTRPLIVQTYGEGDMAFQDYEDVIMLFRKPSVEHAKEKLKTLAKKLDIDLTEVPDFLEDYGDTFLSVSYFRQCTEQIQPTVTEFLKSMNEIRRKRQFQNNTTLQNAADKIELTVRKLMDAVTERFEEFDAETKGMWENITAERFRQVEN